MASRYAVFDVSARAPIIGSSEIEIRAEAELVWDVLTDFEGWPSWNQDVKSISMQGDVVEGSTFRWKAGPGTITSIVRCVVPPRFIGWTGKTLGITAIHFWWLDGRAGTTFVRTAESYEGLVARLFRWPLQKTLESGLENGLRYLKEEAERRAARETVRQT